MARGYAFANGWRWAGWYLRRRKFAAALRQVWAAYVRGDNGESCQDCGRPYLLWHAKDDLYGQVTGRWPIPWNDGTDRSQAASGLFCLDCFGRMAEAKGLSIIWQPEVFPGTGFSEVRASPGKLPRELTDSEPVEEEPGSPSSEALAALATLNRFRRGDPAEQAETLEVLRGGIPRQYGTPSGADDPPCAG